MLDFMHVTQDTQKIVSENSTVEAAKLAPSFFTRKRKMSFPSILLFILKGINTSTQTALNRFFRQEMDEEKVMSQQAFSKARSHFDHSPFEKMFRSLVNMRYCGEHEIELMYGCQILAIDGSDIALPDMPNLLKEFGGTGRNADSPTAKASLLYDVLNDFIVDAAIDKAGTPERELALKHMEVLSGVCPNVKKLLIFDRGYPSAEMVAALIEKGFHFVMRVRRKWNDDVDRVIRDKRVQLTSDISIRVVRFELPGGEKETLISDLFELPFEAFKGLYFKRWPIETKYDVVKNKLELENFSGYSKNIILQDFWASMHVANMVTVVRQKADADIQKERAEKNNRYTYVANLNRVIATTRDYLVAVCLATSVEERERLLDVIHKEIRKAVIPVRPGRSTRRPANPRKAKFHHNRKPAS